MSDSFKQSVSAPASSIQEGSSNEGLSPIQGTSTGISEIVVTPDNQNTGHLCALCNCGERSLLGQGDTWRFEPSTDFDVFKQPEPKSLRETEDVDPGGKSKGPQPTTWRRSRGPLKSGRERSRSPRQCAGEEDSNSCHISDELALVGFHDDTELCQLFEPTGHVWVHHYCAMWSEGVTVNDSQLQDVDKAVYKALSHRCTYCRKFGASILCCVPDCGKRFHFPCASAGGCFQDAKTVSLLCPDHIDQAEARAGEATTCIQCGEVGSIRDLLFCTSCGHHYHGSCFSPPVDMKPIVRAGWQCPNCKICQTCRTASDESKMLVCDKCDKGYHTFCLKPAMTTIPKNGWKCKNCRVCTDCESRTPGSGPSSRWHLNYSVCDSCYQQRNKGLCCPLCGKAYRHFHNKTMLPCMQCKKFVHIECDPTLNLDSVSKLKDLPQDYICTVCRETDPDALMESEPNPSNVSEESMESYTTDNEMVLNNDPMLTEAAIMGPSGPSGGLTTSSSQDSLFIYDDSSSSFDVETPSDKSIMSPVHRRDSFEITKKSRQKSKHGSDRHHHHHHQHHQQAVLPQYQPQSLSEKRRGPKIKVKIGGQVMGITTLEAPSSPISHHSLSQTFSLSSPAYSAQSMDLEDKEKDKDKEKDEDDDDGDDHPSTIILADASDMFVMDQDMCKACGSLGKGAESKMIVCTQCGQCYHPYCVSVTVTKVMLQKGWRCLDCTVCEGCGGPYDEGRLLLCDDCDISYHTYCLDPPLETVPKGNWKCKWCVQCMNCGSTSPGFACQWMNNYTQCGPCHSKIYCPVCMDSYLTDQLIIQCQQCDRWLHCECDGLHCEDDAELAADYGYQCIFCRPKTGKDGPLPPPPPPPSPPKMERAPTPPSAPCAQPAAEPLRQYFVDGVYLFASGLYQIKQRLQVTNPKKLKTQQQRRASQLDDPEDSSLVTGLSGATGDNMDQGAQDEIGEDGVKKRKPRRVFGLGVGGFIVRQRSRQWLAKRQASYEEQEDPDKGEQVGEKADKPKRRRKIKKSKLEEAFPFYMQEAFFGKGILDQTKESTKGLLKNDSDSEPERSSPVKMIPVAEVCNVKLMSSDNEPSTPVPPSAAGPAPRPNTSMSGSEQSEDIHSLDDLKEIMNEDLFSLINDELKDEGLSLDGIDAVTSKDPASSKSSEITDNMVQIFSTDMDKDLDMAHIITDELVNFDSKTVEDIFSGVLSDPHPSATSDANTSDQFNMSLPSGIPGSGLSQTSAHRPGQHPGMSSQALNMRAAMGSQPGNSGLPPFGMPFSHSYQQPMSQRFSPGIGPPGPSMTPNSVPPWGVVEEDVGDSNKRTIMKWEQEEEMGDQATISCVLYVNMCHPDLKQKYPDWSERCKQIAKLWRKLTPEEKAPYLSKARKNRTSSRVQKAQKQVSQELQRRQEIQKQQDTEAMPPPPAPPPLTGEHFIDGSSPVMSPHPGSGHYQRLSWPDDINKPPGTPSAPDNTGAQTDQVFSPPTPSNVIDPYAFTAPTQPDPFSPTQMRPGIRPYRLPGVHAFGASSPRDEEGLFTAPGVGQRVRPNSDMYVQGSPNAGQDMFIGGSRGPRINMPVTVDASNPLGDSNQPRPSGDPYAFPPSTPQSALQQDDPFMPSGPLTPDHFHNRQRGDMFPGNSSHMKPQMTQNPHMSEQGQVYPGSPVRMSDFSNNFRHPLARSHSLPDSYNMQIGTPRPQMDPSLSHSVGDVGPDAMYRNVRMPMQMSEDGSENPGGIPHQQLRVILGQQTKQRMAKKQEEAERMMTGPPSGWHDGSEGLDVFPTRPPFRGPSPQGFVRGPHPGMPPQVTRPPFYPGFMQPRLPMAEPFGNAPQEALLTDQRSPYLHTMQDRIAETNSGPSSLPTPQHVNIVPYSASQQPSMPPPTNMPSSAVSDSHTNLTRHLSGGHQAGEDEIFSGTSSPQATAAKVNVQGDGSSVEADTLLEGIGEKSAKPSLSSEEDKNEDDDLLSADGTFDILKYTDPDLDLDLDDKMFEHLDFIDESHTGDDKKSNDEKAFDLKDESKDEKDHDGVKSRSSTAPDFQAQFLEFNQRHKLEAKSESDVDAAKIAEEKEKEKTEVGQIAAMLQGTEALASTSLQDIKPSGLDPSTMGLNRPAAFLQNLASPHMQMSPSQGQGQPGSSGLPSPKIMQSPRSGQPSPRTPGIQSPFNALLSGRHSASPHSQPMTPAGPQLSPFSASNAQNPFSPPASAGGQGYGQGPGSAPHSPYPTTAQPPFGNLSSPGPPHMMSPGYPPSAMGPRGPGGYNQMGHSGGPRMPPMYSHGIRGHDGQPGRFPRPGEGGLEGIEGLGPRMPQPMSMQDGRPHPMYQSMQQRGMRVPPPLSNHPGMPQMGMPQSRHQFPGQPPRLSHPPQVRGMGPRQPGPPFQGGPPGGPQNQAPSTLLDELLEQEKEEQKRQAEQQAMMHRRDVSGEQGMHSMSPSMSSMSPGIPNISAGMPPVSGVGPSTHNMGGMPMRMDHPGMRMTGPADASGVWNTPPESSQFQQGFPPRLMHPGMPQRSPAPFPGPPDIRVPGPSGAGPPPGQQIPIGPPTPVSPPTGDMGPEYERQAAQYEDYLNKQTLYLEGQVKTFEGQVNKLKRSKKTIQARQRLAKKNNQELNPVDTNELERISTEQSGLQKQLEAQRKLLRQHQHLIQDYKTKQQEQFGRMWTGGMADTPMSNPALPISHPRTPGGHNSVRLSPTARQEYEAYMHNRIRMATQQQQQQNRMRPPTTIIGDNNPFSEAFQQREQIRRAPMTPGPPGAPSVSATPAMPLSPMPPPPGSGSQPLRPPFNIGVTNDSAASPTASSTTGSLTPTSLAASPTTPLNTVVAVSTASGAPVGPPPSPMGQSQITTGPPTLTSAPQGQSLTNPTGPVTTGPRGQLDGMGAMQFYRERNIPFDGSGGPRFPRPPGPQVPPVYSESSSSTGPRLPPYPANPPMFPQATGIESSRLPFQQAMAFQQGPMQPSQITDVNSANSTGQKEKKKRKKKKKSDEAEGTQSQPLPPTLPSQVIMGQMSGQVPSSSSMNQVPPVKPAELPKPQSETDRRILEILNNSQKELQNPSSPSSARGGKSPRSRSPARAPPVHILEADKSITSLSSGLPLGGSQTSESQPPSSNSNSDTFAVDKQRLQTDPKNPSPGGFLGVDSQTPTGSQPTIPSQSLPPHLHRMPMHPHGGGPPMPPTLSNQQHIQHLQNLTRMQHFQQQQFTAMSEGPRHSKDSAQIPPLGGPRYSQVHPYPQRQRYPPGVTPPPMPYQNRLPPQIRTGHPQYPPHLAGVPQRVPIDPRMQGPDGHMIPQHNMMQQRMPASPGLSHLPPGTVTHQGQHLQQINQAPPLTHMPPISSVNQYPGTSHMQGIINMAASNSALTSSTALVGTSQAPIHESSSQPTIPPVSVNSTLSSLSASSGSSINSISTSSVSSLSSASVSSVTSEPQTTSPSHIPADANNQSQNSSSIQQTVAANSALSIPASELASTSKVPTVENQNDNVKKMCDDGIHCGTDDEEEKNEMKRKKACSDGINCGTDDEDERTYSIKKKKICDDGIHCGTDDEEDSAQKKKVCDDGIHCGTDDEEDVAQKKKICSDGIHCGTDDEDEKDVPPILTHNLENFEDPSKKLSDSSKLLDLPETKHSQSSDTLTDLMDSSESKVDTFDHIQASMSVPLTPEKPAGTVVVTMLSPIDSEVSSKLAAVSQSLANFKPRIDSDESSEVSIRPSETLTALSFTLPSTVSSSNLSEPFSCTQGLLSSVNKTDHVDQISGLPIEQKVEVDLNTDNCSIESDVNVFEMTKVGNNDPPVYTSASQVIVSLSDTVRSNVRNPSSSPSSVLMITPLNSDQEQLPAPMSVTLSTSSEPPLTPVSLPSTFSSTLSSSASPVSKAHIVSSSQHSKSSSSSSVNLESSATISPSSGSRNSDNRPVIPPLRIRMDGQSQPQVCESPSMPRDGHRSEFSAVSGRSKTEGDLKLILRKSSDGTAELISGPFKDKSKRSRSDQEAKSTSASVHSPLSGATITSTATPSAVYSVKTLDLNSTPPTVSSHQTTSQLTPTSASSCASTSAVTITEPFSSKPGSNLFKNVTYTKSPDNDIVKINVGSSKVTGEGTKKVIRSYTTDVQALERLQSTIDAVASGESSYEPDFDSEPPSGPSSHDSHGNSTPRPPSTSSVSTAISTSTESGMVTASNLHSSVAPGGSLGQGMSPQHNVQFPSAGKGSTQQQRPQVPPQQTLPPQSAQSQQLQQQHAQPLQHPPSGQHSLPGQHPQTGLQQQQQQQHPMQMHHPPQQQSSNYMAHSQTGFNTHPGYHPSRITRPPLDLLQQVSQSALSSAGTAIPTSTGHQVQQEQRSPFMTERSPSAEHSPLHTSPHQSYTDFSSFPGMMGSRPMGSSPGVSPKTPAVQTSQAYMPISGPPQQQFMQGGRFPSRMHEMPAAPPYGMTQHPMSPTGSSMHRQRPPHFGMVGDMNRMARPPRNMSHPQHRPMPPDMMSPDHPGMRPRMASHQFMSPTHPGMQDMPPSPHGMTHTMSGMQPSPHPMHSSTHPMQSSHVMQQNSAHNMPRPQMMGQHHPVMQGPPSPYSQNPMGGNGGPLASLANFHPPGHPGINTSMGSPMPGPHHRPPQMFNPMIGDARMANQLRMMAAAGESNHMQPHYRHMMMRGMTSSTPPSQMSPHLSPQMSPNMQTQPLRHLDTLPDDKNFVPNLLSGGSVGIPGLGNDHMMNMGGRSFNQGMHPGDSSGFMPMHPPPHLMAPNESGTHLSRSSLSSPMSDSCVKLEPSEDSVSADGSVSRDELDLESKTPHNELLKQLLGTGQNGRQLPTPDSEDSLPSLTPEQQRQLEMIDSMPLCKETEISTPEWEAKTPEEKEKIMEMRKQEYEQKRQEYEVSRKNKRKTLTGTPIASTEKKKRKAKGIVEIGIELPKKRLKKSKLKENQIKELEAQAETFLQQLHNMPPISLQEPIIATSMSILPVKGATSFTGISALKGRYCSAYLENIEDMYGSLLFPQPPPGLRPTPASAETLAQRQLASETKIRMMQGIDAIQMLKAKEGLQGPRPGPRTSPRLILPPQPRIEIKSEQMRERKEERETPDTIVSSSSPEFGFNDQEPEFPGLRPIDPATNNDIKLEDTTSPVVPLVHPLPVKPALSMKESSGFDVAIKHEFGLMKQDSSDLDHGMAGPSAGVEQPCRDLTVNLPNLTSGLAQPFLDPALDQQVSVTLTLSTGAAQDIGAVISAIADLLKIAVPPTYEITRSPSPEMFRMSLTHKEEAVNIHTLMSARPRFCQHCDVFVLCSGIAKYKREFPILLEQDPECGGDDEMIFCSMNCSMQFSVALETRQRQAQLRIKDESGPSSAQSPPLSGVKLEIPSGALTPTSATVSSNVDEIIAAVAADTSLSPDTPGEMSGSPGTPSTTPTSPFSSASPFKSGKRHRRSSSQISDSAFPKPVLKKWRGLRWKRGNQELLDSIMKLPSTPVHELDKLWQSLGMIHRPKADVLDSRKCLFCHNVGDGESDGPSRLLNVDINKWVHLNCALWSYDVYETLNGALMNVEVALERSNTRECVACRKMGATLPCFKSRCTNAFHMPCARLKGCMFYQDKTMLCPTHIPKVAIGNEMSTLVVLRRVYINRDEDRQVASMFHQEDGHCCLRVGSLILHSIGQLLPHQILCGKFNTKDYIYPVGFKTSRFYWSYYSLYQRCRYICSIHDNDGEPEFRIQIVDSNHEELVFKDSSPAAVWMHILKPLEHMRREADLVKMFPSFKAAEDLFGLTDQNIVKVLESLPGTDLLQGYNFKYGRSPLIEMPPAINPTGCARAEPKLRTHFRRPHTLQSTNSRSLPSTVTGVSGDINSPYLKQFVHSKSQQYRRLKTDWKSLVYLGRSRIQGLGLYAARDLEKHTMVIEYIGDLIRNEVANRREKEYESQNRGVYMFRIDNDVVIDATMAGGPARYINHSCNPNCVAEVVDIEKESKIIIITSRKIVKGEELTYDYKFDFEDDQHKIPCMCGAVNCRKWMN